MRGIRTRGVASSEEEDDEEGEPWVGERRNGLASGGGKGGEEVGEKGEVRESGAGKSGGLMMPVVTTKLLFEVAADAVAKLSSRRDN